MVVAMNCGQEGYLLWSGVLCVCACLFVCISVVCVQDGWSWAGLFLFFAHAQKSRATAKKFKVVKVKATFLCNKKCLHCVAPVQLQVPALSMSQPLLFCEDIWCLTESGVCLY